MTTREFAKHVEDECDFLLGETPPIGVSVTTVKLTKEDRIRIIRLKEEAADLQFKNSPEGKET